MRGVLIDVTALPSYERVTLPSWPSKLNEYLLESTPRQVVKFTNWWVVVLLSRYSCRAVHSLSSPASIDPHCPLGVQRQQVEWSPAAKSWAVWARRRLATSANASPRGETLAVETGEAFSTGRTLSSFRSRCACCAIRSDCALTVSCRSWMTESSTAATTTRRKRSIAHQI